MSEPTRMELTYGIDFDRVQRVTGRVDGRMVETTHYPIVVGDREISWVTAVSTEDGPTRVLAWRPAGAPEERGRYLAEAGSAAPHEFDTVLDAATALYTHHVATQQYLAGARTVAPADLVSLDELDRVDDQPAPERDPRAAAGWDQRVADFRSEGWNLRQAESLAAGANPDDLYVREPECGGCGGPFQFGIGTDGELCASCTDRQADEDARDERPAIPESEWRAAAERDAAAAFRRPERTTARDEAAHDEQRDAAHHSDGGHVSHVSISAMRGRPAPNAEQQHANLAAEFGRRFADATMPSRAEAYDTDTPPAGRLADPWRPAAAQSATAPAEDRSAPVPTRTAPAAATPPPTGAVASRSERALCGAEAAIARIDLVAAENERAFAADRAAHVTRWAAADRATTADRVRDSSLGRELF